MFVQEYVVNGATDGPMGEMMAEMRWDAGYLRPFIETDPSHPLRGQKCAIINTGRYKTDPKTNKRIPILKQYTVRSLQASGRNSPVFNATALPKEVWIELDKAAHEASRYRLQAWPDLQAIDTYTLNGMSKMILEHETLSDVGVALQDMDGTGDGKNTMPMQQLEGLPLPITYAGWEISQRKLMISQQGGRGSISTTLASNSGRRIGELLEKQAIGVADGLAYGGNSTYAGGYGRTSQIYGMVNFPARMTYTTLYNPTFIATGGRDGAGWTPEDLVKDFLAMMDALKLRKQYGPFTAYVSNDWDQYLDGDYYIRRTSGAVAPTKTLRARLMEIEGISKIQRLDFLMASRIETNTASASYYGPGGEGYNGTYPFTVILAANDPMVRRAVSGLGVSTVQWESKGGAILNFRTMCIEAPQYFADFYGNCGIMHANASASPGGQT